METDKADAAGKQNDNPDSNEDQEIEKCDNKAFSVAKLFTMPQEYTNRCTRCGREEIKESVVLLSNLLYTLDGILS